MKTLTTIYRIYSEEQINELFWFNIHILKHFYPVLGTLYIHISYSLFIYEYHTEDLYAVPPILFVN